MEGLTRGGDISAVCMHGIDGAVGGFCGLVCQGCTGGSAGGRRRQGGWAMGVDDGYGKRLSVYAGECVQYVLACARVGSVCIWE